MKNKLLQILFISFIVVTMQGCIVGTVVSAPFKVAGAVVNTVTPDIVGDTISGTGDVIDAVIPF
ncbi:DUF6726 family protein [Poseidonibacter ostreae]|jgi:hypothetical protein|uniref:Lipoprotein n=1 Tax=Poseidonibacter ostreae TaxID=2654171 RepID=A0A6L4WS70_9BACT|nr:DUF6726 family protein [Poseidonibacter ostreae]KAB7886140.1 hypothetical protein GA417_06270 [Poseidonibacter ostreae]KAB7887811.1 hypothetical protein GBG18_13725 [Poseidonibacter ostreae]KAB7888556.1 hypothetical protein GBG19_08590 [Poseidonibacter ostreae]MAC84138.1 hypothetical protein [Arcobacter sp.]|tara:strand:+ start:1403 stop:1594 length:192 start_codon:yes stop_codon:yes gene_type:complete